jgi:hypothetical protein
MGYICNMGHGQYMTYNMGDITHAMGDNITYNMSGIGVKEI